MENAIKGKELFLIFFNKIFTSDILNTLINLILPCILSIHCINYKDIFTWLFIVIFILIIMFTFNIISSIVRKKNKQQNKQLNIIYNCYSDHCLINSNFATSIYRLNKTVNEYIKLKKPISKKAFDNIADFQTFSFSVCQSIHRILVNELGKDILCEVTLMRKENNSIKMVAYANDNKTIPSSYNDSYSLDDRNICFIRLFNDLEGEIYCISEKDGITDNFFKFNGSKKRENKICQYIGIPVKTDRNEIEFVLQIDVSKPYILGKTKDEMMIFAKNVLYPYAILLQKSYERDLVFNQYYDMIVAMLSNH